MFTIQCPRCGTETSMSLTESIYDGPFRCWKCSGLFLIRIEDRELKSWQPLSEEELEKYNQNKTVGG